MPTPAPPPPDPTPPPPFKSLHVPIADSGDEELLANRISERNSLHQVLLRDRQHRLLISRAAAELSEGRPLQSLEHLQAVLDSPQDSFFWDDTQDGPVAAHEAAASFICALPEDARRHYETIYGPLARQLHNDMGSPIDTAGARSLLRQYFHTAAGRETALRAAGIYDDTGRRSEAAQLWKRILADPWHRAALTQQQQHRAHCALRLVNQDRPERGRPQGPPARLTTPPYPVPLWQRAHYDDPSRPVSQASVVPGPKPLGDAIEEITHQWQNDRVERMLPVSVAIRPLVVGSTLVYRDYAHVRAVNVRTGATLWTFRPVSSLITAWEQDRQPNGSWGTTAVGFSEAFAGNSLLNNLSTDGQRIYFIDDIRFQENAPARHDGPEDAKGLELRATNTLVALPVSVDAHDPTATLRPQWVRGGVASPATDPLDGHFFLGPPATGDGRLYVMTESAGQINLVALDPLTGEVEWIQGIGLAEFPIYEDPRRARIACSPVITGSVVVCPTDIGLLVGVDAVTGRLLWAYHDVDDERKQAVGRWTATSVKSYGLAELPSQPVITHGRVYYLPDRSQFVHSVDLDDGSAWKAERESARFIAAVTQDQVVLIGDHSCMGISLADRKTAWQTRIPTPSGRGIQDQDRYLLPTQDGQILCINLRDGTVDDNLTRRLLDSTCPSELASSLDSQTGAACRPSLNSYGDLLPVEDLLVSVTPTKVAVYPQAGPLLDRLTRKSASEPLSEAEQLTAAKLQIQAGSLASSRTYLRRLLESASSTETRIAATALLREVLHAEVRLSKEPELLFDEIATLATTSQEHARLLVDRLEFDARVLAPSRLIELAGQLENIGTDHFITQTPQDQTVVSVVAQSRELLAKWRGEASHADREQLVEHVRTTVNELTQPQDLDKAIRIIRMFRDWPEVASLRNRVARWLIDRGRLQEAELLVLQNTTGSEPQVVADALRILAELYWQQDLSSAAAECLVRLRSEFQPCEFSDGLAVADYISQFRSQSESWTSRWADSADTGPVATARIHEHRCDESCDTIQLCECKLVSEQYERVRRRIVLPEHRSMEVLDVGAPANHGSESLLRLYDSVSGRRLGEIPLPIAYPQIPPAAGSAGQLLFLGGNTAHALSLLDRRHLWESSRPETTNSRQKVRIGPRGLTYCVIQSGESVSVVDPATGELIWRRDGMAHDAGLHSNEVTGIIGDASALIVFESDQLSYSIYSMDSGRLLGSGCLPRTPDETLRVRHAAGSHLCYVSDKDGISRVQIWKPLTKQFLLDEPLFGRMTSFWMSTGELAYISADGDLCVVSPHDGRLLLETPLAADLRNGLTSFSLSADSERFWLDLVHDGRRAVDDQALTAADDLEILSHRLRGHFVSINRHTGQVEWDAYLGEATAVQVADSHLPILVLVRRRRDSHPRNPGTLQVEVRDAATGGVLGLQENLLRNRIIRCNYDPTGREVTLIGVQSHINIRFGLKPADGLIHASAEEGVRVAPLIR